MKNLCLLFLVGLATGFISEKLFVSSQTPFSTTDDLYIEGRSSGDLPIDDEDGEDDGSGSGSGDYGLGFLDKEEILRRFLNFSKETLPLQPQPTADSPHNPPTTAADSQDSATTVKVSETTPFIFPDGSDRHEEMPGDETTRSNVEESVDTTTSSLGSASATSEADSSMVTEDADMDNSLDRLGMTTSKDEVLITDLENEIIPRDGRGSRLYEMDPPAERSSESLWERTDVLAAVIACGVVGLLCAIFLLSLLAYRMKKKDEGSYDLGDTKLSATAYHKAPTKEFYA